ncbi:hypothetical protein BN2476_680172 [Paraburkholderia piptadeniae]|uniref:Uncharacterized protein n=1 Tax=Paraburkholderia piptadeniae TaxID=1701573 RepID=A0A1N7SPY7_9BURK|nr:hypothetical protein BN2476_680172 [Paraburkholderia piptadeniae]
MRAEWIACGTARAIAFNRVIELSCAAKRRSKASRSMPDYRRAYSCERVYPIALYSRFIRSRADRLGVDGAGHCTEPHVSRIRRSASTFAVECAAALDA